MSNVPVIGLDHLHVATVTTDNTTEVVYGTAQRILNITQANINFNMESSTFFADNGPAVVYSQMGEVEVTINVGDLTPSEYALLTGTTRSSTTGVIDVTTEANPPDMALGFRAMKSNGEYRYIWLMKGKFTLPNAEHQTKESAVNFQPMQLTFSAVGRVNDQKVMRRVDSDDENLPENVTNTVLIDEWFADPDYVPATPTT